MVNITDVAKLAGVSHQTVSRVINDEDTVAPATRARVEVAIRELNYRPSAAARALVRKKTGTVGMISTGNPLHGPSSTALAVNEAARAAGYQVATASMSGVDRTSMLIAVDLLLRQDVEALVLIAADVDAIEAIEDIELGVPLVTAESSGRIGLHSVSIDQFHGARLATGHLADLGHRVILFVSGPSRSLDASERERGWRHELEHRGLPVRAPLAGDWSPSSGYRIGVELSSRVNFTAIVCANDQMALGLLHAFNDAGVGVPSRVSIVGFDDIPEAAHFIPPLTTVRQDFGELGRGIVAALVELLQRGSSPVPVRTSPALVVRESTAPPAVI